MNKLNRNNKILNKNKVKFFTILLLINAIIGCGADDIAPIPEIDESEVGFTTVALDANKPVVRGGESPLGNLIADAFLEYARSLGHNVDFAMANGGNIRFSTSTHPDGVYPVGILTQNDVNELLPFNNTGIIVQITGAELRSTFERSVHFLPIPAGSSGNGAFAQLSSGIQIVIDTSLQAQVIDELNDPIALVTEGQRVVQVTINGNPLIEDQTYLVLIPSFAAGGGDGFVALGAISSDRKIDLNLPLFNALGEYLKNNSPVTPIIENRILID